jgi:hypothetical protein
MSKTQFVSTKNNLTTKATSPQGRSVQDRKKASSSTMMAASQQAQTFVWHVTSSMSKCPAYWSVGRDNWLANFVKREGNDILAGVLATVLAKVVSTNWYIEGPVLLATLARNMLLHMSEFYGGWDRMVSKWANSYLGRDFGGVVERFRSSQSDHDGPALGYAHLDESLCLPTGDPEWPVVYNNPKRGPIKMHRSQVMHIVDSPESRDIYKEVGYCSVSRSLTTALILLDVLRHKRELLSDLPPSGIMFINNLSPTQWDDIVANYDARQHNQGNEVWRDVLVALGVDPAYPITVELLKLSQLWEGYDEKVFTELAVYAFALGFRKDAREFWPVSSGALGTATETEIQHQKAKAKGEGSIFVAIERQFNAPESLPLGTFFRFDYQEDEEDQLAAEIKGLKITNVRRLWEASPAASKGMPFVNQQEDEDQVDTATTPREEEEEEKNEEEKEREAERRYKAQEEKDWSEGQGQIEGQGQEEAHGIITTEEARNLLVRWNVVPADILNIGVDVARLYDVQGLEEYFGPPVRVYRNGLCLPTRSANWAERTARLQGVWRHRARNR